MIFQYLAAACVDHGILGLTTWYQYLNCNSVGAPIINNINDIWSIAAAIIDILLKLSALIAVGITIYGGAQYMTSSGNAEKTNKAKNTILYAVIGLAVALTAEILINFVLNKLLKI